MRPPPGERVTLPDGRKGQIRLDSEGWMTLTHRTDVIARAHVAGDPVAARAALLRAASLAGAPKLPPVLDMIERARALARDVARLDEIEREAVQLRESIAAAMGGA